MSVNPLVPANMASSARMRNNRENNRNNSFAESSISLSEFTETVSSRNRGFLGGLGATLMNNFNNLILGPEEPENKKIEKKETIVKEGNTTSTVIEIEDSDQNERKKQRNIHFEDEKRDEEKKDELPRQNVMINENQQRQINENQQNQMIENNQRAEVNDDSRFINVSQAIPQMEEIIRKATMECMQQYMTNDRVPIDQLESQQFKEAVKEAANKSAQRIFCDERVRHSTGNHEMPNTPNMSNEPIVIEEEKSRKEKEIEKKQANESLEQSFLKMMIDQNKKQQETMLKLFENANGKKKDDENKANSKVVQDHILSKPPSAYKPICADQSIVTLLAKTFEKYLRNRMLNNAETKIALMTIFRDSASAEEKVKKIVEKFEGDLKVKDQRIKLYKAIIKKLKGNDEDDEIYEKYDQKESLFDYFLRLRETVEHNQPELTPKKLNRKTLQIMLSPAYALMDEGDRRYCSVEKERSMNIFDFSEVEDVEKFFSQIQKLKNIAQTEQINLINNVYANSGKDSVKVSSVNDSNKTHEINYMNQNNSRRGCHACGREKHRFRDCRDEVKVREYWSKNGPRFNENFKPDRNLGQRQRQPQNESQQQHNYQQQSHQQNQQQQNQQQNYQHSSSQNNRYRDEIKAPMQNFKPNGKVQPVNVMMSTPNNQKQVSVMNVEITDQIFNTGNNQVKEVVCNFLGERCEIGEANEGRYLLIDMKMNGTIIESALDTGCTAAGVISKQLVVSLGLWPSVSYDSCINLRMANGHVQQTCTTLKQRIAIGGKIYEQTFIVVPHLNVHVLIGKPLLKLIGIWDQIVKAIELINKLNSEKATKKD